MAKWLAMVAAALSLAPAATAEAEVRVAWLPGGTSVAEVAAKGLSPGLMSAGLGSVPAGQTYLDISQGNRVFDSLYDSELPAQLGGGICGPPYTDAVRERAESAPADIAPGLLAATLRSAGRACSAGPSDLAELGERVRALRGDDLVIAIERPPPAEGRALAIGIAGRGFDGNLTSDSTRFDGYVLSTDVAPTVLDRLGVAVPAEMSGEPIRSTGKVDPAALESLGERMAAVSERRGPVIGLALAAWLLVAAAVLLGREAARQAVRLLGLSVVYLPLVLLLAAALEPSQPVEQVLTAGLAPLLALLTLAALGGYRALATASALTVLACAVDVIIGSPLTSLSLLGPNPGLGVRFYGIGNELEAALAVLVIAGTGAALSAVGAGLPARRAAIAFLAAGALTAGVFAIGRFGADVGAAIVLPFGAAIAAATVLGCRRRLVLLATAAPLLAVALLALADLISGADAHLTRSVLDAGGLGEVGEVVERRLRLSARSFTRPIVFVFMPLVIAAGLLAILGRRRIAAWLRGLPALRAGMLGALAAVLLGALANDSGALILEVGGAYLLVFLGFAWAESNRPETTARRQKIYTSVSHL
jgi:hypothetical protein